MKLIWDIRAQKQRIAESRAKRRTDLKPPVEFFALVQCIEYSWGSSCGGARVKLVALPKYKVDQLPDHLGKYFAKDLSNLPLSLSTGYKSFLTINISGRETNEDVELLRQANRRYLFVADRISCGYYGTRYEIMVRRLGATDGDNGTTVRKSELTPEIDFLVQRIAPILIGFAKWERERNKSITGDMLSRMIVCHHHYNS